MSGIRGKHSTCSDRMRATNLHRYKDRESGTPRKDQFGTYTNLTHLGVNMWEMVDSLIPIAMTMKLAVRLGHLC